MRLFVSEFICGGGWSVGERPTSLAREGAAMWRALLHDLLRIPSLRVVTTWDQRLSISQPELSRSCLSPEGGRVGQDARVLANAATADAACEVIEVSGPEEEREVFARLCRETDATYVIAPELDDELSRRVSIARGIRSCNSSVEAIDLCGDKWALYEHFKRYGRPTIPTTRVGHECDSLPWPRVLKLRMGAGSQAMQRVASPAEWDRAIDAYDAGSRCTEAIAQPWIRGRSLSVGAIIDRAGTVHVLPVADQFIDPERGFAYLGGRISSTVEAGSLDSLIRDTLSTIPGLFGYVGVDVLLPDDSPSTPLIVEINPRLTTSYVGYQKLCLDNLAALWIGDETSPRPLRWRPGCVEFNAAGEFR